MRALVVGAILLLAVNEAKAGMTGTELYRSCVTSTAPVDQASCFVYMAGLRDGYTLQKVAAKTTFSICLPPESNALDMRSAIEKYLRENPKKRSGDALGLAIVALHRAYPCKNSN
jgi:hypothetical protein